MHCKIMHGNKCALYVFKTHCLFLLHVGNDKIRKEIKTLLAKCIRKQTDNKNQHI